MEEIEKAIDELKFQLEKKDLRVVIIPHISPDGDAVGAWFRLVGSFSVGRDRMAYIDL